MFPLGSVLFPTMVLPLHVFEPRYRELTRACLDGDREFGVVLIERGSEVGGGDVRFDVGTVARIVDEAELEDGRWVLATVGTRRIRVDAWLPDAPYPRADISDWEDPPASPHLQEASEPLIPLLRRVLALTAEVGEPAAPATVELSDDPVLAGYQAAAVAPLGPSDKQRLLAAPSPEERLGLCLQLLADAEELLRLRLGEASAG